ncbi:hypothetical protein C9I57_00760 [Trinickia symbiotica]|uniref:Alginate biosynthesis protein AlgF n=2 Tax=Trinickia symbiotica TaxID=863227 RepID=A0A2T3Y0S9_9BURK|nr:hypothetical protein C9I57_00760 [Trinickia symbiotica]
MRAAPRGPPMQYDEAMTNERKMKMKQSNLSLSLACCAAAIALGAIVAPNAARAAAQDVANLYGPQPPADATYLRVVNLSGQAVRVALPGSARAGVLAAGAATKLSVVTAGTPLRVAVDGKDFAPEPSAKAPADAPAATNATAGIVITVALTRDADGWHTQRIAMPYARTDALRATLRVLNFAGGCDGKVIVDGSHAAVFANVPATEAAERTINPVTANLVGQCGPASTAAFALPKLAAGDSYTLILSGSAAKPVLSGTRDELAWPAPAN